MSPAGENCPSPDLNREVGWGDKSWDEMIGYPSVVAVAKKGR